MPRVLNPNLPNLRFCPLLGSGLGETWGRVWWERDSKLLRLQLHRPTPPRLSQLAGGSQGGSSFPRASLGESTFLLSGASGLGRPGVLCLSQPRLPPALEPAQRSGFVRDSPGSCLELGVGTACLACPRWVGCRRREGSELEPRFPQWPGQCQREARFQSLAPLLPLQWKPGV